MIRSKGVKNTPRWPGLALLALVALAGAVAGGLRGAASSEADAVRATLSRLPLVFEANRGQAGEEVKFLSRGSGYNFFLTPGESYVLLAKMPKEGKHGALPPAKIPAAALGMRLIGGNEAPRLIGLEQQPGRANYIVGQDESKWRTGIKTYAKVKCEAVYPGIDLLYYGNQQELEHDFVVSPGTDPRQIRILYRGAKKVTVDHDGELLLHTSPGVVRQKKPFAYQEVNGVRKEVAASYLVRDGREVTFRLGDYDADRPLVIDPVLRYSTFIGGTWDDYAFGIAVDGSKNAYITGYTGSFNRDADTRPGGVPQDQGGPYPNIPDQTGFPTVNPFMNDPDVDTRGGSFDLSVPRNGTIDGTWAFSHYDAFVTKLSNDGRTLLYSTYLGGQNGTYVDWSDDYGLAIAVDDRGNAYVTGMTESASWPLVNPVQGSSAGFHDTFVTKLSVDGSSLVYSTYIGGSGNDRGRSIAVDSTYNAYVAGITASSDFPTYTTGVPIQTANGGGWDAFVVSLDASGSDFNYSTYLGGSGDELGYLPFQYQAAEAPYFTTIPGTLPMGSTRTFSAFNTPFGLDYGIAVAVDALGNAHVTGGTTSRENSARPFPLWNAAQPNHGPDGSGWDAFVTKFSPAGAIIWSTFLGGNGQDAGRGIAVDATGYVYITGYTTSDGAGAPDRFPVQRPAGTLPAQNAYQDRLAGGYDAFVTKLNSQGRFDAAGSGQKTYSTYLGGTGTDVGNAIRVSSGGQAYVVGFTGSSSSTFPRRDPFQSNLVGGFDAFVTKFKSSGADYEYSTYLGSPDMDWGLSIAVDASGQAYVTGTTTSAYFPRTLGARAFSTKNFAGVPYRSYPDADVFVSKFHSPPSAPSGLRITEIQQDSISLAWTDESDNEDGFEIERKDGSGNFAVVAVIGASVGVGPMAYTDTGLDPDVLYTYRIRPFNTDGGTTFYGAYSNQASARTRPGPPIAASNLAATLLPPDAVRLQWQDNSDNETGFRIQESTDDFALDVRTLTTVPADTTQYTVNNRGRNTVFYYRIVAVNATGAATPSPSACVLTLPMDATNLSVSTVSDTALELTFTDTNPSGPSTFRIERSDDSGRTYTQVALYTPPAPARTVKFVNGGLTPNKRYFYRVRTTNSPTPPCVGGGDSPDFTNTANGLTLPAAASGLTVTPDAGTPPTVPPTTDLILSWTDNNSPDVPHLVERSTDNFVNDVKSLITLGAGITQYRDTSTEGNRTYYYRVVGRNAAGDANPSNVASALSLPAKPLNLDVQVLSDRVVQLTWQDKSFAPTQFAVERSIDGGSTWNQIGTTPVDVTQFQDNNRTANQEYCYRVRGFNASGNGAYSDVRCITILPAPTGLTATAVSPTRVILEWTDNSPNETEFLIERRKGTNFVNAVDPQTFKRAPAAGTGSKLSYNDQTVQPNTRYVYRVIARRVVSGVVEATSAPSPEAGVLTPRVVPATPTLLSVQALSETSIRVQYRDNSTDETGFKIERKTAAGGFHQIATTPAQSGTGTVITFDDTGLTANQRYTYRVRATNGADSPYSAEKTTYTLPAAPTNLVVGVLARTRLQLYWRDNNTVGPVVTKIERSANGGSTWAVVGTVTFASPGGTKTFVDHGLQANKTYHYRVRTTNDGGNSAYSNTASAQTLASVPGNSGLFAKASARAGAILSASVLRNRTQEAPHARREEGLG